MNLHIALTYDQEKRIKESVLEILTFRELANNLFSKLVLSGERENSEIAEELFQTLSKYLKDLQ